MTKQEEQTVLIYWSKNEVKQLQHAGEKLIRNKKLKKISEKIK